LTTYPAFDSQYVSVETSAFDHYCDVPLSTTKGDFRKPATILYYSARTEGYRGEPVAGVDKIMQLSGDFATSFARVMPQADKPDVFKANMAAIQSVKVQTLSEFQGRAPKAADAMEFPAHGSDMSVFTGNLLEVMQFVANHTSFDPNNEMDAGVLAAIKPLGVEPGKTFDPTAVAQLDKARIEQVVKQVAAEAKTNRNKYLFESFRPKGQMQLDAMVAQSVTGPVGQPADQAVYIQIGAADDAPLNAAHDYVVRMTKEQLPPARAFWSMTLYDGEKFLFIPNPSKKYSVGENAGMKLDDAGGITIHIAAVQPAGTPAENWLPINRKDQPLNLRLRVYAPDLESLKSWSPPKAAKIER
jgi:hypothetical protein